MGDTRFIEYVIAALLAMCLSGLIMAGCVWYVGGLC